MLKTFLNGFIFGLGFLAAVALVGYVTNIFYLPETGLSSEKIENFNSWNDLDIEGKLEESSSIYIIRYRAQEEGLMQAYIAEIHRKDSDIEVLATKGDLIKKADFYSRGGKGRDRDGAVVFLIGSPASERSTLYLYDNRLSGGADMPIDILVKKFTGISGG